MSRRKSRKTSLGGAKSPQKPPKATSLPTCSPTTASQKKTTSAPQSTLKQGKRTSHGTRPVEAISEDKEKKLLCRLYEPLVLSELLPGNSPRITRAQDDNLDKQRGFLDIIARICDYEHGGDTVTAVYLEDGPDRYVFGLPCPAALDASSAVH